MGTLSKEQVIELSELEKKVPVYTLKFIQTYAGMDNIQEKYPEYIESLPNNSEKISYNQWVLLCSMFKAQKLISIWLKRWFRINKNLEKLEKGNAPSSIDLQNIEVYKRNLMKIEKHIYPFYQLLIKYSNSGVDRETPKKVDIDIRKFNVLDIQKAMRNAQEAKEAKFKEVEEE